MNILEDLNEFLLNNKYCDNNYYTEDDDYYDDDDNDLDYIIEELSEEDKLKIKKELDSITENDEDDDEYCNEENGKYF